MKEAGVRGAKLVGPLLMLSGKSLGSTGQGPAQAVEGTARRWEKKTHFSAK